MEQQDRASLVRILRGSKKGRKKIIWNSRLERLGGRLRRTGGPGAACRARRRNSDFRPDRQGTKYQRT